MFSRRTLTRFLTIPCASVSLARLVAQAQRHTINIVESAELTAGYQHGEMLFCTSNQQEIRQWLDRLGLKEDAPPAATSDPRSSSSKPKNKPAPKSNDSGANTKPSSPGSKPGAN